MFLLFFFSSRRRHTRFDCDWSSDVCSSDLHHMQHAAALGRQQLQAHEGLHARHVDAVDGLGQQAQRSEEHTSELQSQSNLVCRLLLEKKKKTKVRINASTHSHYKHIAHATS